MDGKTATRRLGSIEAHGQIPEGHAAHDNILSMAINADRTQSVFRHGLVRLQIHEILYEWWSGNAWIALIEKLVVDAKSGFIVIGRGRIIWDSSRW